MSVVFIFTNFKEILSDFYSKPESYVQSPNVLAILLGLAYTFIRKLCTKQSWLDGCRQGIKWFSYNSELKQEDSNIIVLVIVWL